MNAERSWSEEFLKVENSQFIKNIARTFGLLGARKADWIQSGSACGAAVKWTEEAEAAEKAKRERERRQKAEAEEKAKCEKDELEGKRKRDNEVAGDDEVKGDKDGKPGQQSEQGTSPTSPGLSATCKAGDLAIISGSVAKYNGFTGKVIKLMPNG